MKLLKALSKDKITLTAILEFHKQYNLSDFTCGVLRLERKGRALYLDISGYSQLGTTLMLDFIYEQDILVESFRDKCDLTVEDLILGLDTCELDVDFNGEVEPIELTLFVENDHTEFLLILTLD